MGTRGLVFLKDAKTTKVWYQHFDAYPGYLGRLLVNILKYKATDIEGVLNELVTQKILQNFKSEYDTVRALQRMGEKTESITEKKIGLDSDISFNNVYKENVSEQTSEASEAVEIFDIYDDFEWTYTVDFTQGTLKIKGGYYTPEYKIDSLSTDWFEEFDKENERLVKDMK